MNLYIGNVISPETIRYGRCHDDVDGRMRAVASSVVFEDELFNRVMRQMRQTYFVRANACHKTLHTELRFKDFTTSGKACLRHQCGFNTAPRGTSRVKGFTHGPEGCFKSSAVGTRNSKCIHRLLSRET